MGGNFEFQVQDSFLKYIFLEIGRFEKRIALSEKKPPLSQSGKILAKLGVVKFRFSLMARWLWSSFVIFQEFF